MVFITNQNPPEVLQPTVQAFDFPTTLEATKRSAILRRGFHANTFVRRDHFNASNSKTFIERIAIIGPVSNEPLRKLPNQTGLQGRFHQRHFMRRSAPHVDGDWKTSAVCHCHDLRTFAPLGLSHPEPPFLATTKVPSMKHSETSSSPRSLRSCARACKSRSTIPVRFHCWNRRWQVWYGGYSLGKSCQGAPVRNIHKTPLSTARVSFQGRPRPSDRLGGSGISGLRMSHCSSVKSISDHSSYGHDQK
jgi:hypothetical protein